MNQSIAISPEEDIAEQMQRYRMLAQISSFSVGLLDGVELGAELALGLWLTLGCVLGAELVLGA